MVLRRPGLNFSGQRVQQPGASMAPPQTEEEKKRDLLLGDIRSQISTREMKIKEFELAAAQRSFITPGMTDLERRQASEGLSYAQRTTGFELDALRKVERAVLKGGSISQGEVSTFISESVSAKERGLLERREREQVSINVSRELAAARKDPSTSKEELAVLERADKAARAGAFSTTAGAERYITQQLNTEKPLKVTITETPAPRLPGIIVRDTVMGDSQKSFLDSSGQVIRTEDRSIGVVESLTTPLIDIGVKRGGYSSREELLDVKFPEISDKGLGRFYPKFYRDFITGTSKDVTRGIGSSTAAEIGIYGAVGFGVGLVSSGVSAGTAALVGKGGTSAIIGGGLQFLGQGIKYTVPVIYGGITAERIASQPKGEKIATASKILTGELAPLVVGGLAGQKTFEIGRGFIQTYGRTDFIPASKITDPAVLSGSKRFPGAETTKLSPPQREKIFLKMFKESSAQKEFGLSSPAGFSSTADPRLSSGMFKTDLTRLFPVKAVGEGKGLFIAPTTSVNFLRISGAKSFSLYGSPKVAGSPGIAVVQPTKFIIKGTPKLGEALVRGIKPEAEAIIPVGTEGVLLSQKAFTSIGGTRIPIDVFKTIGAGSSSGATTQMIPSSSLPSSPSLFSPGTFIGALKPSSPSFTYSITSTPNSFLPSPRISHPLSPIAPSSSPSSPSPSPLSPPPSLSFPSSPSPSPSSLVAPPSSPTAPPSSPFFSPSSRTPRSSGFTVLPSVGGAIPDPFRPSPKFRQPKRRVPSFRAAVLGIEVGEASPLEYTGLGERGIIRRGKKKKKKDEFSYGNIFNIKGGFF